MKFTPLDIQRREFEKGFRGLDEGEVRAFLLEVAADEAMRYSRLALRSRAGDAQSFAEFRRQEAAELASGDPSAQQLGATAAMADVIVQNDGDLDALHGALELLLPMLRMRVGE